MCGACRYGDAPPMRAMSSVDRAWLTAILEGEGTFGHPQRAYGQIRVTMTDRDVVERLREVTGLGLIHNRGHRQSHHKDVWDWAVTRKESVCALAEWIAPILLSRRRASVETTLQADGRVLPAAMEMRPGKAESWAWVAGLIEGEGWIAPTPDTVSRKPVVGVESTDLDVIERLAFLSEVGQISELRNIPNNHKQKWRWTVTSRAATRLVLVEILPLLGERRTNRAKYVLGVI
jgi:hypothetical protein